MSTTPKPPTCSGSARLRFSRRSSADCLRLTFPRGDRLEAADDLGAVAGRVVEEGNTVADLVDEGLFQRHAGFAQPRPQRRVIVEREGAGQVRGELHRSVALD